MFLWEAAPILLSRKGYATDVRRDCLALSLWLLTETHATGDEKSLSPSTPAKTQPRRQRLSLSSTAAGAGGSGGGSGASTAPSLAAALSAENLVAGNDRPSGGGSSGGQGAGAEGDNSGRASRDHAVLAGRGQYWSAHLTLVRVRVCVCVFFLNLCFSAFFWGGRSGREEGFGGVVADVKLFACCAGFCCPT